MFGARCLLIPKDDPQNEAGVMSWPNKLQIPVTTRNLFFRFSAVSKLKRRYSCRKKDNLKIVQKLKFIGKIIMAYHITKINIICHICLKVLNRYPEKDKINIYMMCFSTLLNCARSVHFHFHLHLLLLFSWKTLLIASNSDSSELLFQSRSR